MAYFLCIETTTTNCSAAVGQDNRLLSLVEKDDNKYSHAEQLHVFIQKAIEDAQITMQQLDAIAVSKGPGSYTGLRIGVSTAKGLCYGLEIPLISISTLQSLAAQVKDSQIIIPMIDARRMEVYTQIFDSNYENLSEVEAKILDQTSFFDQLKAPRSVTFIGNGVKKFKEIVKENHNSIFMTSNPSARDMIGFASKKFNQRLLEDVAYFEPLYLKEFIAGR